MGPRARHHRHREPAQPRLRRRQLRLLRQSAVRHHPAARPLASRCLLGQRRLRRGRRPRIRQASLPRKLQAAYGAAGRQPDRRLPRVDHQQRLARRGDQGQGAGEAVEVHADDRLHRALARLHRVRRACRRRPGGEHAGRGALRVGLPAVQGRQAGRQGRVADEPADRERLLRAEHERHRVPGGHSAASFLQPGCRGRRELRRHRRGDRSRDRPRLRRPGRTVRR